MKNKIITIFIILICLLSIQSFVHAEEGNSDLTWTDCSNATVEIKDYFYLFPNIYISNININNDHEYFYCITNQNTKPITNFENISIDDITDTFSYMHIQASTSLFYTDSIAQYLELNQDLYLWVLESNKDFKYNYIIEGKKLDRPEYPKNSDAFHTTYLANNRVNILFNMPWDTYNTQRKINIKIGKIEDISILNKFKNSENDAFQKLLEYSKTANSIYNNKLTSTKTVNTYDRGYSSDTALIDLNLLQDKAYYFLYAQLDDENGKYYPFEAITIGQADIINDLVWMINFKDISYGNLGDINPIHQTTTPSTTDTTLAKKSIPFAGSKILIIVAIIILILLSIIGQLKYKKYKDIK